MFICALTAVAQLMPSFWLTEWLKQDLEGQQDSIYPIVFSVLVAVFIVLTMIRSIVIFHLILSSATNLHNEMTRKVLRANILFFDSNPIGRIVTRFSKDLIVFDLVVPIIAIITLQGFFRTVTVVITIAVVNYWMIPVCLLLLLLLLLIFKRGTQVMIES